MFNDEKLGGRFESAVGGSASPLRSSMRTSSVFKIALIVLVLLFTETAYAANGNANSGSFSKKQIAIFVKTVQTELELSKNWNSSFAKTTGSNMYCHSIVLGEGVRAGSRGLYTWFTCSALHKLTNRTVTNSNIPCTGFSSPVWIEPAAKTIRFQTLAFGPEYIALRNSAPVQVRKFMDSTFKQMNSSSPRVIIARATQGAITQKATCQ